MAITVGRVLVSGVDVINSVRRRTANGEFLAGLPKQKDSRSL